MTEKISSTDDKKKTPRKTPKETGKELFLKNATPAEPPQKIPMVAIGASAGGLEPFEDFFDSMPVDSGIAFVVIQHLSPDFESMMDELLSRHSSMTIKRVVDKLTVEANTIYLNPPRSKMVVEDGRFWLREMPEVNELNLPIDIFFESLALEYQKEAIAIVLSGTGSDGTIGAAAVKAAGGTVLVQSLESAKFDGMPRSVIESGKFDAISGPTGFPSLIERVMAGGPIGLTPDLQISDDPGRYIFHRLHQKFGTDFGYYKEGTIRRRFARRAQMSGMALEDYARDLDENVAELESLYADLLIDVTSFFRDPKAFASVQKHAIEPLASKMGPNKQIRIWIAGCSSGEEAYSFAIAFDEYAREHNKVLNIKILATDVHKRSLGAAAEGLYPQSSLTGLSEEQVERYFDKHVDHYQVKQELRRLVLFSQHNLLRDPPFTRIDLLTCRNVLIYFQEEAQRKTLALFHFSLLVNGYLFLGPSESLGTLDGEFKTHDRQWKVYQKLRDVRLIESTTMLPTNPAQRVSASASPNFNAGRTGALKRVHKTHSSALEVMLKRFAPPGFLLNRNGEVIHVFGAAGQYVKVDGGVFSNRIIDLIDPQLKIGITAGLERLTTLANQEFERRVVIRDKFDRRTAVTITLTTLATSADSAVHYLLILQPSDAPPPEQSLAAKVLDESETSKILQGRIVDLERDLLTTEETLQALVEELQTSNEELQATNEELMGSNEELQSTNEELHSVNEELHTVSFEHQRKIDELTVLSDDMNLLLQSTSIGIIFLDGDFNVRRFTPSAVQAFNLLSHDVGRPFEHTTYRFDGIELMQVVQDVHLSKQTYTREITVDKNEFILSVMPYESSLKNLLGIVITLVNITDLKAAERERLSEKEIFETVVNDLPQSVVRVNVVDGEIVLCNDIFAKHFGKAAHELTGKCLQEILPADLAQQAVALVEGYAPGDSFQNLHKWIEVGKEDRVIKDQIRVIGNDEGKIIAYQAVSNDITDEYRYTSALQSLLKLGETPSFDVSESLQKILEIGCRYLRVPNAILSHIYDNKYVVKSCEGYAKKSLKPGDKMPYSETFCYHLTKTGDPLFLTHIGESDLKDETCYKKTKIETYVGIRIITPNGFYGALSFSSQKAETREFSKQDITIVHLLGQTAAALCARENQFELLQMRQKELENVNEGLNRFTYLASHDLQEPLRKIQQSGDLLNIELKEHLNEETEHFLDIMMDSAGRMRALVDDLLSYSSSANRELDKKEADLKVMLEEVVESLQSTVTASKAKIKISNLPKLACDPTVTKQVFINILSNSLKYRSEDVEPIITVTSKSLINHTRITVKDNGIGIDLERTKNILEPFVKLHSKDDYSGSGIGLAICKSVCDRHGWDLEIKSKLGKGTEVILTIPNEDVL